MSPKALTYLDSSFVVSLYSIDANSAAASAILQQIRAVRVISPIVVLEAVNAFELRVFRKEISRSDADLCRHNFETDLRAGVMVVEGLRDDAFVRARSLSARLSAQLGTRAFDVLHVALALEFGAAIFTSFDLRQREMARIEGLRLSPMP